ncbi:MAG: 1-deoxy-D-xylulose-5-phosphate reductoisomerase [Cyanobacteria bacterium]|nr:1-deoxy-D-xylulose-5-phosphate reductoisomerase [Cyanobacteriota bacterium]
MNSLTLLGATGSIGTQVLDVVRQYPDRFKIRALAAGKNLDRFIPQIQEFQPQWVSIQTEALRKELLRQLPSFKGEVLVGEEGLNTLSALSEVDTVIVGLVGILGLKPTLTALELGKKVLTANKETFVSGGHLVKPYLNQIIPIDSEHSAIHQCLKGESPEALRKIFLTASGGPFRDFSQKDLETVTLAQALKHPNWVMGPKITIDSATLMNKGLEVIEAHWLFDAAYDQIQVVVHPESIIHSGIELVDGSILVQMGAPDMHLPIQYAMAYPDRLSGDYPKSTLDVLSLSALHFHPPDPHRFPCLDLAYQAGRSGPGATCVLNAADEAVVQLFLEEKISFLQIPQYLEETLSAFLKTTPPSHPTLAEIYHWDQWARDTVAHKVGTQATHKSFDLIH